MIWGFTIDGEFSTKSATWLAQGLQDHRKTKCNFHWIWKLRLPQKEISFLWNICVNGPPTKHRLLQSKVFIPLECEICNFNSEDKFHLFVECTNFKRTWSIVKKTLGFNIRLPNSQNDNFIEFLNLLKDSLQETEFNALIFTWWAICSSETKKYLTKLD